MNIGPIMPKYTFYFRYNYRKKFSIIITESNIKHLDPLRLLPAKLTYNLYELFHWNHFFFWDFIQ